MEENISEQPLTKEERKQLRRQEKHKDRLRQEKQKNTRKKLKMAALTLLFLGASVGVMSWFNSLSSGQSENIPRDKGSLLEITSDDWIKGNKEAQVAVIEYLDFECEACGAYYPLVKRISEEYGDRVSFVTRYFPLPGHKNSMTAATAVEAAGLQGKYWEMYDILFENQKLWGEKQKADPKIFEGYAEKIGVNMDQFKEDVTSKKVKERVERDRASANRLGVDSTPTFFLGGEKIENPRGYEAFKSLLDDALKQQGQ